MRKEYDFSKAGQNSYGAQLNERITIQLDEDCIRYFKGISDKVGIPYQSLISLYLRECALTQRELKLASQ